MVNYLCKVSLFFLLDWEGSVVSTLCLFKVIAVSVWATQQNKDGKCILQQKYLVLVSSRSRTQNIVAPCNANRYCNHLALVCVLTS